MKKILITLLLMSGFSCLSLNAQKPLTKPNKKPQKTQTVTTPNKPVRQQQAGNKPVKPQKTQDQFSVSLTSSGTINGHGYVDLGLSVKWATYNVGATSPSNYGDYFAWGETATKSTYTEANSITWKRNMGDIVTGPNGKSIFLPAEGVFTGSSTKLVDDCGYCWSSTPIENDKKSFSSPICYAYEMHYTKYGYKPEPEFKMSWGNRDGGSSIRPVSE